MRRAAKFRSTWAVVAVMACSTLSAGCLVGQNLSFNLVVPLGLGGTPGLLNPFGLVQAFVNFLVSGPAPVDTSGGSGASTGGSGASTDGGAGSTTTPRILDPAIPLVTSQNS